MACGRGVELICEFLISHVPLAPFLVLFLITSNQSIANQHQVACGRGLELIYEFLISDETIVNPSGKPLIKRVSGAQQLPHCPQRFARCAQTAACCLLLAVHSLIKRVSGSQQLPPCTEQLRRCARTAGCLSLNTIVPPPRLYPPHTKQYKTHNTTPQLQGAPEITAMALTENEPLACVAVDMFLAIVGAEAGAMALRCLARGERACSG